MKYLMLTLLIVGCGKPKMVSNKIDPVFHCGAPAVDPDVEVVLDTMSIDSVLTEIGIRSRWFVITKDSFPDYGDEIDINIAAFNDAANGYFDLRRDSNIYHIDEDLFISNLMQDGELEKSLVDGYGDFGYITFFVIPTSDNLLGFTRLYESWLDGFKESSELDNIFISTDGLLNRYYYVNGRFEPGEDAGLTVIHEMGHFMLLKHEFENKKNFMSYHCYRDEFTTEQLESGYKFMIKYRNHVLDWDNELRY